jgi:hypothetical protein
MLGFMHVSNASISMHARTHIYLTLYSRVVTVCTMDLNAKNKENWGFPTQCICLFCMILTKQRFFTQTAITGCHFEWRRTKIRIEVVNVI